MSQRATAGRCLRLVAALLVCLFKQIIIFKQEAAEKKRVMREAVKHPCGHRCQRLPCTLARWGAVPAASGSECSAAPRTRRQYFCGPHSETNRMFVQTPADDLDQGSTTFSSSPRKGNQFATISRSNTFSQFAFTDIIINDTHGCEDTDPVHFSQ